MSKTNEERLNDLFARLDSLSYIKPDSIPDIPLYMDQVTTFIGRASRPDQAISGR